MRQLKKSLIVPILTILWLTCQPDSVWGQTDDRMVTVPASLLRAATAKIDSLSLELRFGQNALVERDSLHVAEVRYWKERSRTEAMRADELQQLSLVLQDKANSWWTHNGNALLVVVAAVAGAVIASQ